MSREDRVKKVRDELARLRLTSPCSVCGKVGYVEWHSVEHETAPSRRVSVMAWDGKSLDAVLQEIASCTPLCKSCHQRVHGQVLNSVWPACGHPKEGNRDQYPKCPICRRRRSREYMQRKRSK